MKRNIGSLKAPTPRQLRAAMYPGLREIFSSSAKLFLSRGLKRVRGGGSGPNIGHLATLNVCQARPSEPGEVFFSATMATYAHASGGFVPGIILCAVVVNAAKDGWSTKTTGHELGVFVGNIDRVQSAWVRMVELVLQAGGADNSLVVREEQNGWD